MIIAKIYGGLAGQMLQYSLARNLSLKHRTKLYLDISWFSENQSQIYPRDFRLNSLNTQYDGLVSRSWYWRLQKTNRFKEINPFFKRTIRESDFSLYDPQILELPNNIILDGYWNSYKYFEGIRHTLLKELGPKTVPSERNNYHIEKAKSVNSISVHFRRGDYKNSSFHGLLKKEYYDNAIKLVSSQISDPHLFIFSDEPDWVASNVQFDLPHEMIDFNKDEYNFWDIEIMKNCKHNIIANSGFSWWGAWLNNYASKMIVAPKLWIAEQNRMMSEFIPSTWIRI